MHARAGLLARAFTMNTAGMQRVPRETLIYSVWRRCIAFFETVEDGRVHSCFKKSLRLAKQNNYAFPKYHLISAFLDISILKCSVDVQWPTRSVSFYSLYHMGFR